MTSTSSPAVKSAVAAPIPLHTDRPLRQRRHRGPSEPRGHGERLGATCRVPRGARHHRQLRTRTPDAPLMFMTDDDLADMKPSTLVVDVSCDEAMEFRRARPTTFNDPVFVVGDEVLYYAVDHSPSSVELRHLGEQRGAAPVPSTGPGRLWRLGRGHSSGHRDPKRGHPRIRPSCPSRNVLSTLIRVSSVRYALVAISPGQRCDRRINVPVQYRYGPPSFVRLLFDTCSTLRWLVSTNVGPNAHSCI